MSEFQVLTKIILLTDEHNIDEVLTVCDKCFQTMYYENIDAYKELISELEAVYESGTQSGNKSSSGTRVADLNENKDRLKLPYHKRKPLKILHIYNHI